PLYYSILFEKVQWEQKNIITGYASWEQNRRPALPAYSILFEKVQWEQKNIITGYASWEQNRRPALPAQSVEKVSPTDL
ncbi:MAG: hypothetical protein IKH11_08620, partial [Bacteroidales bacterium]|nr:hypothetical protein [Bacteroidales bacterium]